MTIQEIIEELNKNPEKGLQVTKSKGILTSTWFFFKRKGGYFCFDISEKIEFDERYKFTYEEILEYYENARFYIDLDVF